MKSFLEWLKPGARVKRYVLLQLVSISALIYSVVTLITRQTLSPKIFVAYIALITISIFSTFFSFILAQRNILRTTLKNMSYKEKNVEIRRLLYSEETLNKGAKVVVIGGGKGLANILSGLKEFTSNITVIVSSYEKDELDKNLNNPDILSPFDVKRDLIALSKEEELMEKLLSYKLKEGNMEEYSSFGNMLMQSLTETLGSYNRAVESISKIFDIKGVILPVTLDTVKLCAGLENGELVVGNDNIRSRIVETKSSIKQVFLKDTEIKPTNGVIEKIQAADVIIIGPGSLYTSVISNLLIPEVSKAILQSKAKKVMISNLMNEPNETSGYTLARYVNEVERYLGKHVLDYLIVNNGEITEDMILDFNQGLSTPVINDLENIHNRTISVIEEDLIVTAPNSILHDNFRVSEIIMEIAKNKSSGKLNLLENKNRKKKLTKKEKLDSLLVKLKGLKKKK